MVGKNHKQSMSQQERAFWREAFLEARNVPNPDLETAVKHRAEFADAAVAEYRKRVTWRPRD